MIDKLQNSKTSGAHALLAKMVGDWEGTTKTWFEPGKPADESTMKGNMRLILDGRFILHEYTGSIDGKPLEGVAIYGYHIGLGRFQSAWLDSFHNDTAIMFSESHKGADVFKLRGSYAYVTPEREVDWGWRTEVDVVNDNEIVFTAFNISPEGEEVKATETVYKRIK
jgi:hypothetical protein